VGSPNGRRDRKELVHRRDALVARLRDEAMAAKQHRPSTGEFETIADMDRSR